MAIYNENCVSSYSTHFICLLSLFFFSSRLFSAASSDSIRFHSNLLNHDNDLRVSIDNTCTDSLVTALDDEALLINDYMNDMSKSKVSEGMIWCLSEQMHVRIYHVAVMTMRFFFVHRVVNIFRNTHTGRQCGSFN